MRDKKNIHTAVNEKDPVEYMIDKALEKLVIIQTPYGYFTESFNWKKRHRK
jgi:hypothetical protein